MVRTIVPVSLPRWLRVTLVAGLALVAVGAGVFTYRYLSSPKTLTVAVGSQDGEAAKAMSTIATQLASVGAPVRLKVVDTGSISAAAKAFSSRKVDLAVARSDARDLVNARTVAVLIYGVVLLAVPPNSSVEELDDLKGKMVGVVGGETNNPVAEAIFPDHGDRNSVKLKDIAATEASQALKSRTINALLLVVPVSERYRSMVRGFFDASGKGQPKLISIDSAEAIANAKPAYESYDLPKGSLRGSPALPADDLSTLRVAVYIVAHPSLRDDTVTALTKAILDAKRDLGRAEPLLAQIAAPSTDKDAYIPVHPGAAAYFDGEVLSFFDKYGNELFYGPMILGALMSALAAAWKFMGLGQRREEEPLDLLNALAGRVREARSSSELDALEDEVDHLLMAQLMTLRKSEAAAADAAALTLAAHRLEQLIVRRKNALVASIGSNTTAT
jgi:TRAP transporter TAXI family solute receptor